jgi:hypothetical protein
MKRSDFVAKDTIFVGPIWVLYRYGAGDEKKQLQYRQHWNGPRIAVFTELYLSEISDRHATTGLGSR